MKQVKDLFGYKTQGINYQLFRPRYPKLLLNKCHQGLTKTNYLDVAMGTGQILFQIAPYFNGKIYGTDLSSNMTKVAAEKASLIKNQAINILTQDCLKEIDDIKFDLITIGQALHWMDIDAFLNLTRKQLNDKGRFVTLAYYMHRIDLKDEKSKNINHLYETFYAKVKPCFDFDRDELHQHYQRSRYCFTKYFSKVNIEETEECNQLSTQSFLKYMQTYSGYNTYLQNHKDDPIIEFTSGLKQYKQILMTVKYFGIYCEN